MDERGDMDKLLNKLNTSVQFYSQLAENAENEEVKILSVIAYYLGRKDSYVSILKELKS